MSGDLGRFLRSEWLTIRTQMALGIVFLVAAWPKLLQPPVFAKNVWAYDMLPDVLVTAMAVLLPGVEVAAGLALVLGWRPRAAAWICIAMLLQFMAALSWNAFVTNNPVNCSCFELDPAPKTCAQLLWDMKVVLLRDVGILALAIHVVCSRRHREQP